MNIPKAPERIRASVTDVATALAAELRGFVEWAEDHRAAAKSLGERPCIDAHRVSRARALLKKAAT